MIGENEKKRSQLKGLLFELIVMKMLNTNGFDRVKDRNTKIRERKSNFVEVRGRGTWHEIDCLCDYTEILPFIYPIRLFGEMKYYKNAVKKDEIREFIGVLKDIQENYFVSDNYKGSLNRVTEIGVFFAANGFQVEAEKLAFAHNIKTISYKNNYMVKGIKTCIDELEKNYLSVKDCISSGNYNDFINEFELLLKGASVNKFKNRFNSSDGLEHLLKDLIGSFNNIKSNFIASTSAGVFLHFIGPDRFPEELFMNTDIQECEIYYLNDYSGYYLSFSNDEISRKFYFTPPKGLKNAAFSGGSRVLDQKLMHFKELQVSIRIKDLKRNLTIRLNNTWLDNARMDICR